MTKDILKINYKDNFLNDTCLEINDSISLSQCDNSNDLIQYLVEKHRVPSFAITRFEKYVTKEIQSYEDLRIQSLINNVHTKIKEDDLNLCVLNHILDRYKNTWFIFQDPKPQSDQEIFANAYLKLVESGSEAMESLAKLELQFTKALSEKVTQRDMVLYSLDQEHMNDLTNLEKITHHTKSTEMNRIEQKYHQNRLQTEINWNSDITALREHQRRDFRDYVMDSSDNLLLNQDEINSISSSNNITNDREIIINKTDMESNGDCLKNPTNINDNNKSNSTNNRNIGNIFKKVKKSKSMKTDTTNNNNTNMGLFNKIPDFNLLRGKGHNHGEYSSSLPRSISSNRLQGVVNSNNTSNNNTSSNTHDFIHWQESFTIHIGRQMRSTHNMRILCVDPFDLLAVSDPVPKFLSTSSMVGDVMKHEDYSNLQSQLSPEIIANRLTTSLSLYSGNLTGIVILVDNRLSTYSGNKKKFSHLCERSTDFHFPQLENQLEEIKRTLKSMGHSKSSGDNLEVGDVYVTRHSNLNVVTVVFHLVIDESTIQRDIKFPSPIHGAIRNILRTCFLHDIFCLNLPLLMTHEIKDYMDQVWCMKRVEAILKAVKGSLMELCTWRGREARTIQFLVPPAILNHGTSSSTIDSSNMNDSNTNIANSNNKNVLIGEQLLTSFSSLLTEYFQPSRAVK